MALLKDEWTTAKADGDEVKAKTLERKVAVVEECRRYVESVVDYESADRKEWLEDLEFKLGKQWDPDLEVRRKGERRPCLVQNMIPKFQRQVIGEARLNKPSMDVDPVDDAADPEVAQIYDGLVRNIEYVSNGKHCYESALENIVDIGVGYWGYSIVYADDDSFEQDIRFRRLPNPFAVYYDPSSMEADGSDASECAVIWPYRRDAIKREYGINPTDFESMSLGDTKFRWADDNCVRVAEYWRKEPVEKTLAILEGPNGEEIVIRDFNEKEANGLKPIRTRKVKTHQVKLYICTGGHLLEEINWPGRYIPIVRVVGNETFYKDRFYRSGMIRFMKDPQRTYNYWWSSITEDVALAPKVPIFLTPQMIKGHEGEWNSLNMIPRTYVLFNPDAQMPGQSPHVEQPPQVNQGKVEVINLAMQGLKDVTGIYDASLGDKSNETSGVAIKFRQREGDVGNYHYIDNLHRGIAYGARILIDLIPKVFSKKRVLRVIGPDESTKMVQVNQPVQQPILNAQGQPLMDAQNNPLMTEKFFDLTIGKYDVVAKVGPDFTTQREAATEQLNNALQAVPAAAPVLVPRILSNLNVADAAQIGREMRELMNPTPVAPPMTPAGPVVPAVG